MNQQRPPSPQLPVIGLQPAARPIDQFVRPEVRYQDHANELIQLANSLSVIRPEIRDSLNSLGQTAERAMREQAKVDAASLSLKNQQDFKDAVDRGIIKQQDNPWYHAQMDQEIATAEARSATNDLLNDYSTSGMRFEKNPQVVDQWVQDHTVQMLKGRSGAEAQAIIGIMDPFRNQLVRGHIEAVANLTDRERQAAVSTTVSGILKAYTNDDLKNPQALVQAQQQIAAYRESVLKTMDEQTVDDTISKALEAESEARASNVFRPILSGIQTRSGVPLSEFGLNREKGEELDHRVGVLSLQRETLENERWEQDQKRSFHTVTDQATSRAKAQGIPFADFKFTTEEFNKLDPFTQDAFLALQFKIRNEQDNLKGITQKEQRDAAKSALYSSVYSSPHVKDLLDPAKEKEFLGVLAVNGGEEDVRQWVAFKESLARQEWAPTTSPDVIAHVVNLFQDGKLTVTDLTTLAQNRQIDEQTFHRALGWALENGGAWGQGASGPEGLQGYLSMIPQMVAAKSAPNYSNMQAISQVEEVPDVAMRIGQARMDLIDAYAKLQADPEFRRLDTVGKRQRVDATFDAIMSHPSINGYSRTQLHDFLQKQVEETKAGVARQRQQEEAARDAAFTKANPQAAQFTPANPYGNPHIPVLSTDQKSILSTVANTGSSFTTPDGRTVYKIEDYKPQTFSKEVYDFGTNASRGFYEAGLKTGVPLLLQGINERVAAWNNADAGNDRISPDTAHGQQVQAVAKVNAARRAMEQQFETYQPRQNLEALLAAIGARKKAADAGDGSFYVTPKEKADVYRYVTAIKQLAYLSKYSTYNVEEVKKMGPDAYMKVPMFVDEAETRTPWFFETAKRLGLKTTQEMVDFRVAQLTALWKQRHGEYP